ncbi:MAG: hypothetical protein EBV10_02540 [Synechococcaceae bacterium WB6_1A_059]|nr:hypothetical protein [Synechococcaceae bacterium WB6_1A_059]
MSTQLTTNEDYLFFDYLAPFRWPEKTKEQTSIIRKLVATGEIHIETLLENAIAVASKGKLQRIAEDGRDFNDNSDAKKAVSCFRNNNVAKDHWSNTFQIKSIQNKKGMLRCLCLSKQTKKFHHFAIPFKAYKNLGSYLEIPLDRFSSKQEPKGIPKGKWMVFEVEDFQTLATITEEEMLKRM